MTDADKIKYLEEWVGRLASDLAIYKGAIPFNQKRVDELNAYVKDRSERIQQLETELAAAKAHAVGPIVVPVDNMS